MTWETVIFFLIAVPCFVYSGIRFFLLYQLMKKHKGKSPVFNHFFKRLIESIPYIFFQKAVFQKKIVGFMHATIFWGFIIISFGTLEQFLSTIYTFFSFEWLGRFFYSGFVWLQDFLSFFVILAVVYAAYRRFFLRPPDLGQSKDANLVLLFTFSLMISILCMNAFLILGQHPWFSDAMPIASLLAKFFSYFQLNDSDACLVSKGFKWLHMLLVLGFSAYIPNSKHLHILAAGPNTFLKPLQIEKAMPPISFEDETKVQYGAAKITDLSWKDTLDYYSCTECGRCQEVCPAHQTGKPLSPKNLILNLKKNLYQNKEAILNENPDLVTSIIDNNNTADVFWSCTSCRACETACPVFIQHTDKIFEVRRNLVMMDAQFPSEIQTVFKNMENQSTPWAFSKEDRELWAEGLLVKKARELKQGQDDLLLWVGCAGSYDERNKKIIKAFISVLNKLNINFFILGKEEQCTGDPARRMGNEYLYQTLAKSNIENLNKYQVKKIVTTCPHCFNTIKNEYPDFGGHYQVFHHSEFLGKLILDGKLKKEHKSSPEPQEKVTFHDSCYLGRWNGIYSEPRNILKFFSSESTVIEMKSHHEKSLCCGAGGGRMWMEEHLGSRINIKRTEEAIQTGAKKIATSCPFCITMISDGLKAKNQQETIQVVDLAEWVDSKI